MQKSVSCRQYKNRKKYKKKNPFQYHGISSLFTLNISYDIDGSKKTYTTPILGFNPIKDLASRNCNVYIYNNEIYVTDFEKNNDGTYHIWPQDSKEVQDVIEKDKNVKAQYKGLLKLCIIIVILLVIISFVISLLVNLKS